MADKAGRYAEREREGKGDLKSENKQNSDTYQKEEKKKKTLLKKKGKERKKCLPTAPGVPRRSPIQVLIGPDVA